ncbi:MAG: hypothetical protein WCS37_04125 [Chloroflexota bacterium]|nr:hypothetical protein [Chloroflexota bacterium]
MYLTVNLVLLATLILAQTATPLAKPGRPAVDPGNEPVFTIIFYFFFMVILIGSGIVWFKVKERLKQKAENEKKAGKPSQKADL